MKRVKRNNDKIIALYCRLSKDNSTNNESTSMTITHSMFLYCTGQKNSLATYHTAQDGFDKVLREIFQKCQYIKRK